ncbi:hypothetical protein K4L44_03095 [Halosquirtibacter laminarini]|uniref:Uncharacterized protein n=1 Tax=Halosquirtibacter laminarini TaxID=3374600 RepID=A0AC61NGT0_9BACT|nr:hypothetical protein K4L44_03095 [Prolixibacteraceae bacterium]
MLPFVLGVLWQLFSFVEFFVKEKYLKIAAFLLVISDPTLGSQFALVSPEIIQIFFFFLALNSLLYQRKQLQTIGLFFLGIVTYRGMMLCAGIFIIDAIIHIVLNKNTVKSFFSKNIILSYIIGATPACIYLIWRITTKGWLISHPLKLYGSATEFSSIEDFFLNLCKNIFVLGFQFIDFGRIFVILFIIITFYIKRKQITWRKYNYLLVITFFSTIVIYTISLVIKNTMGHRYYIVSFLSLALLSFLLLKEYRAKKIIYTILLFSLLGGNFIVYSDSFAQGWPASLAHMPYWELHKKAINYMDDNEIPIEKTASFFPNETSINNIYLNEDKRSFSSFSRTEKYVLYSNVYNLTDDDLRTLHQYYHVLQSFENHNVRIDIMQRND